jgi:hypothetical protein
LVGLYYKVANISQAVEMQSLGGPVTEQDKKELHELLTDEARFEKMVERAVRGMRRPGRRARRAS